MIKTETKFPQTVYSILNVPNLRFPGFEGEWERHIIGDFIKLQAGYAFKSELFRNNGIPIVRISNLPQDRDEVDLTECVYYDDGEYDNYVISKGDLLIAMSGATTGKTASYRSCEKAFLNQRVGCFRTKKEFYYPFIYGIVESSSFQTSLRKKLIAGAQPNISSSDIETIPFFFPDTKEQQKIADLLSLINQRILIQSKVIEDLISLEKVFINSSFRDIKGENIPLSVISQRIVDRNANCGCSNVLTISAKDGLVSQLNYFKKSVASQNLSNYYLLQKGDFAYNKSYSTDYPWGAVKHLENYNQGILSPLYFCFRANSRVVNIDYLQLFFDTDIWYKHISEIAVEGARNHGLLNMSVSDFMAMPILLPSLVEQNKIVNNLMYFRKKKQSEIQYLMALEKQKKYLLSQMFI